MHRSPSPPVRPISSFRRLTALEDLDAAIDLSRAEPVFVFKHSESCGTSAEAHEELTGLLEQGVGGVWYLVDVRTHRSLSATIAERFSIRHESPQILLIVDGQVRWSASHYRVTSEGAQAALARIS
jgi:bacillithiol system protein YtxJ